MSTKELVLKEIEQIPETYVDEILDFVLFLKSRISKERLDPAIMSETSLGRDWLKPQEDSAWTDL